ncbi:MAG: FAD-dependent oxidoreductase, partial [Inquilinus sp.]|nr:FAD-dependent oxidoreductase [Inquilinus sp.]
GHKHRLITRAGSVHAGQVLIATNGYTEDALHPALAGTALPVISSIVTTEPLSEDERAKLGWTTETPLWDSRHLLHYGRLLADGRLLLGGRGDTVGGEAGQAASQARLTRWFHAQFPDWAMPPNSHSWSGLASMSARRTPMVGALKEDPSVFYALAYHGNGVATGTWAGRAASALIAGGQPSEVLPAVVAQPPKRFPVPALRRLFLRTAYAAYGLRDAV